MAKYKVEITGINTNNIKSLTHKENIELINKMKEGDKHAKEELINGNLKLVLASLKYFNNRNCNLDDLFQVGVIGLIKAIDNFDPSLDLKLSTYAIPLILGEIKKYLRDNTQVRISRSIKDNAYLILSFKEQYINEYGIEPTIKEIEEYTQLSSYDIYLALNSLQSPTSIFEPVYNEKGDDLFLEDQISDTKSDVDNTDDSITLNNALNSIKERERSIIVQRYLIGKTQSEIADSLNISQAQVSRLEKSALVKMRKLVK